MHPPISSARTGLPAGFQASRRAWQAQTFENLYKIEIIKAPIKSLITKCGKLKLSSSC
jgi:hypothetical protein